MLSSLKELEHNVLNWDIDIYTWDAPYKVSQRFSDISQLPGIIAYAYTIWPVKSFFIKPHIIL